MLSQPLRGVANPHLHVEKLRQPKIVLAKPGDAVRVEDHLHIPVACDVEVRMVLPLLYYYFPGGILPVTS